MYCGEEDGGGGHLALVIERLNSVNGRIPPRMYCTQVKTEKNLKLYQPDKRQTAADFHCKAGN